jgi:hypothetical protein
VNERLRQQKSVFLIILLIFSTGATGYLFYDRLQLKAQIDSLETLLTQREDEVSDLGSQISVLGEQKNELEGQVTTLKNDKSRLEGELKAKEAALRTLQRVHDTLLGMYDSLEQEHSLECELRIGNSLESYYDGLRESMGPTGTTYWWAQPDKNIWQIQVEFAANLAQHDLWRIYWPFLETGYENLTGENSYETAWNKLGTISPYIGVSMYDGSEEVISKVLTFLQDNIHYEGEVNDVFLAPVETLGYKSGDCDDYSILSAAFLEYYGIDAAIGFFKNDSNEYHAMVLINLNDLKGYHYWYYENLTDLGLSEGQWIKIDPQATLSSQGASWMGEWNLLVAKELEG